MPLTYDEFKDHLIAFLWKFGDPQLTASLDNLVAMADAELRTSLRVADRETSTVINTSDLETTLPADYKAMRGIASIDSTLNLPEFKYMSLSELMSFYSTQNTNFWQPMYSLKGANTLVLLGPTTGLPENEIELFISYKQGVPDYKTMDSSWVSDEYLNVYTYCVLKHSSMFVREDERLPNWGNLYGEALGLANEYSAHEKQAGVYESKSPTRQVGIIRRR